jgi:iron(III) transport system ATP-binding protein
VTEFVARFIGSTNILRGHRTGPRDADCDGLLLTCETGDFPADGAAIASIRPHRIVLGAPVPAGVPGSIEGTVERAVYLGAQRHFIVALDSGTKLQVMTSSDTHASVGERVGLTLPPAHCRALVS